MKIGLVGIEQSGVTTIFEGLSGGHFNQEKTGRRHTVVQVPDSRVDFLSKHYNPKKTTYIQVEFIEFGDITKSISEAKKGFGEYVAALRELDGIVIVLRYFETEYQLEKPNPKRDLDSILSNFSFADMDVMMKRIEKLEKTKNKPTKTQDQDKRELEILKKCQELLENEEEIKDVTSNESDFHLLKCFGFLTMKPLIFMVNIDENDDPSSWLSSHPNFDKYSPSVFPATLAAELTSLSPEDRDEFLADLGFESSPIEQLLHSCLKRLNRQAFFTVGEDEVRAWLIPDDATSVVAAGAIHSDLARGFIRAEVTAYKDFVECGDMKEVKAQNKQVLQGKDYIVNDGDIINIRFNV